MLPGWSEGLSPALVWGLVPRCVGAVYLMTFAGLAPQVLGLIGSRGVGPVREQLAAAREHFPGPGRFFRWPTLFWLTSSDRAVRFVPLAGIATSLLAIYGGPLTIVALGACYALLLTLDVIGLWYPWDAMAFEAGVLALFLPSPPPLPHVAAALLPAPLVAFAWRLFLARVMWGFARVKFVGTRPGDSIYVKGFLGFMPQTTPLGHRIFRLPAPLLRAMYAFMWFAEVVCPGLTFFAGAPRVLGAAGLVALMIGVAATGNWGWFNIGYAALCVVFFDSRSSLLDASWTSLAGTPAVAALSAATAGLILLGVLYSAATNTWSTLILAQLPLEEGSGRWTLLRAFMAVVRALAPYRLVAGYGVFPPNSKPPIRPIAIFQGSQDGVHYESYEYRYFTSSPRTPPRFIAPHHPRLDHLSAYVTYGWTGSDYFQAGSDGNRVYGFTPFTRHHWLDRVAQRLLEGEPTVLALFGRCPFRSPPNCIRVVLRAFEPTESAADARRGVYWIEHDLGELFPPRRSNPGLWRCWQGAPETFHPGFVAWRRSSPALRAMVAAHDAGAEPDAAVQVASDFGDDDVRQFWTEFVPQVARARGNVAEADASARELEAKYGLDLVRFERLAGRFTHLLRARIGPAFFRGQSPAAMLRAHLPFHFLLHEIVLDGRTAFLDALRGPPSAARERMAWQTDATALHYPLVVHNERMHHAARALRYFAVTRGNARERSLPGLPQYRAFLRERIHRPAEFQPTATCHPSTGQWTIAGVRRVRR